jgi:rod shape-determining protein MreC
MLVVSAGLMSASDSPFLLTVRTDLKSMLDPVTGMVNGAADTAGTYWSTLTQLDSLRTENERLRADNKKLQEQTDRIQSIQQLNDAWTKISQANESSPYQTSIARVIVRDISDVGSKTLVINRGTADGLAIGQVVQDDNGALVGRIIGPIAVNSATVLLVNDLSAVAIGQEADTGAIGTIHGLVGGKLQLSYVNAGDKLNNGQPIVTAGLVTPGGDVRSPYPHGLLIGRIVSVQRDPNLTTQSALVQPAADLENIEWVLVILDYKGGFASPGPSTEASPQPSGSGVATPTPRKTAPPTPLPTPTPTPRPTPTPSEGLVTPPPH